MAGGRVAETDKEKIVTFAREFGFEKAAEKFKRNPATIKSWVARSAVAKSAKRITTRRKATPVGLRDESVTITVKTPESEIQINCSEKEAPTFLTTLFAGLRR